MSRYWLKTMIPPVKTWSLMGQRGLLMFNRVHTCFAETHTHTHKKRLKAFACNCLLSRHKAQTCSFRRTRRCSMRCRCYYTLQVSSGFSSLFCALRDEYMKIKDGVRRQSNNREKSCESKWDLFASVITITQNN